MEAPQSRQELEANLAEYRSQLKQVEELLLMGEHVDDEMQAVYANLTEVIQLTEELLKEAMEAEAAEDAAAAPAQPAAPQPPTEPAPEAAAAGGESVPGAGAAPGSAPPGLSNLLPASVADQIRRAQIRAVFAGQAPASWLQGAQVQAVYAADGQYYDAVVTSVTEAGNVVVAYEGYAEREELPLTSVRERPEKQEVYTGVAAPKRKRVEEQPEVTELPKWLEIQEGDDDKTKAKKRKLIKSYKSKIRFQKLDQQTKKKQDSWKDFMSGKGSKKKAGFLTSVKKDSIFSVGEGTSAKVGVTGSGKGMTNYSKARKVGPGGPTSEDGE